MKALTLTLAIGLLAACPPGPAGRKEPAGPVAAASCSQVFPGALFGPRVGQLTRQESRALGEGQGRYYSYRRALDQDNELQVTAVVLPADPGTRLKQAFTQLVQQSMEADREQLGAGAKLLYDKGLSFSQGGRLATGWHGRVLATPGDDPMGPSTVIDHYLFQHRGCLLKLRLAYPTVWQKKLAAEISSFIGTFD